MNNKIKEITIGAMLVGLFGVLGLVNLYSAGAIDIVFSVLITIILATYGYKYNVKTSLLVILATGIVLFIIGNLYFTVYTTLTMFIGLILAWLKKKDLQITWPIYVAGFIKNFIIFYLISGLIGFDIIKESQEIIEMIKSLGVTIPTYLSSLTIYFACIFLVSWLEGLMLKIYFSIFLQKISRSSLFK